MRAVGQISNMLKINEPRVVYFFAALCSLILSIGIAYQEKVINPDAICYLQSAAVIGDGGLRKAMNLCPQAQWPLYSVLIYFLSYFTHLPLMVAAFTLDAVFSVMTVLAFISLTRQLGGRGCVLWLAAMVILLAHQFNSIRQYLIRDHGFWAFYLISLSLLLHYLHWRRWFYALGWSLSLLLATLFRIEGIVFLIFLPWGLWFLSSFSYWQRFKSFLQLYFIPLVVGFGVLGWLIFHPEISLASLGRIQEFVFQLFHVGGMVWQRFQESAMAFAHGALTVDSLSEARLVFFLAILMWYGVKIVGNLSLVYSLLLVYALIRKVLILTPISRFVLVGYLMINLIITSLFLAEHLFLSKRYLIAFSLVLMLWVPFALHQLLNQWQAQKLPRWIVSLVFLCIVISSLGGIFNFGYSKAYIRQAGDWLAANTSSSDLIYSNDYQVMYYAKHFGDDIFQKIKEYREDTAITNGRWKNYDYVVLRLSNKDFASIEKGILHEITIAPIHIFSNKRGDQVRIYRVED